MNKECTRETKSSTETSISQSRNVLESKREETKNRESDFEIVFHRRETDLKIEILVSRKDREEGSMQSSNDRDVLYKNRLYQYYSTTPVRLLSIFSASLEFIPTDQAISGGHRFAAPSGRSLYLQISWKVPFLQII